MAIKAASRKIGKENAPPRVGSRAMSEDPVAADGPDPLDEDEDVEEPSGNKAQQTKAPKAPAKGSKSNLPPKFTAKGKATPGVLVASRPQQTSEEAEEEEQDVRPVKSGGRPQAAKRVPAEDQDEEEDGLPERDHRLLSANVAELEKQLAASKATAQRAQAERDAISKRFEQLSDAGGDAGDRAFDRYKEKADVRAKAQSDVIATQKTLIAQLEARAIAAEQRTKAALSATPAPATAPAEHAVPAVVESADVEKIKAHVAKEAEAAKEQIAELKRNLAAKDEQFATLQKDYETEVRLSKEAAQKRSTSTATAAPSVSPEDQAKDAALIKLYEDLTNLTIPSIRFKEGGAGQEVTFVCVQTMDRRSLNFKLKTYKTWQEDDSHAKGGQYVRQVSYEPQGLGNEQDHAWVEALGVFAGSFVFPREQGHSFWCRIRDTMEAAD